MALEAQTMRARDLVASKLANCFITIEGDRYLLMQGKKLEAKFTKNKKEVPILGRTGTGHRTVGWNGTGSMTIYHNTSLFTELLKRYQDMGEDVYFDIQITNEDPTSSVGRQTVILKDCNLDSGVLAAYDAEDNWLEQEVEFTFESFELPEKFKNIDGMKK